MRSFLVRCLSWGLVVAMAGAPLLTSAAERDTALDSAAVLETDEPETTTFRTRAFIDGRSWLYVSQEQVWWHHYDYAAPGLHELEFQPTVLDDFDWFPEWPLRGEVRDCDCDSQALDLAKAGIELPSNAAIVSLQVHKGRGKVSLIEDAASAPGLAAVLEFNDNTKGGASWYEIELKFEARPDPPPRPEAYLPVILETLLTVEDSPASGEDG